jgi:ribonuclease P protein component
VSHTDAPRPRKPDPRKPDPHKPDHRKLRFTQRMKLHGAKAFAAVYGGRVRAMAGFLTVYAIPNQLAHNRLGLSVPKAGGTAIRRNLIKRRLREAFRRSQHELPRGYDLAVRVRPHEPRSVEVYEVSLREAVKRLHESWQKRTDKEL